jgi:hypothetical protein
VSVLFTLAVLAVAGAWALTVYRRLFGMREQVKLAWKRLEADQSNDAIKTVYNKHVTIYNAALESFPAYLIAPMAGLKPANLFEPNLKSEI